MKFSPQIARLRLDIALLRCHWVVGWRHSLPELPHSPERMKKPKVRKFGRGATFLECHEGTDQSEARLQRYAELSGF